MKDSYLRSSHQLYMYTHRTFRKASPILCFLMLGTSRCAAHISSVHLIIVTQDVATKRIPVDLL